MRSAIGRTGGPPHWPHRTPRARRATGRGHRRDGNGSGERARRGRRRGPFFFGSQPKRASFSARVRPAQFPVTLIAWSHVTPRISLYRRAMPPRLRGRGRRGPRPSRRSPRPKARVSGRSRCGPRSNSSNCCRASSSPCVWMNARSLAGSIPDQISPHDAQAKNPAGRLTPSDILILRVLAGTKQLPNPSRPVETHPGTAVGRSQCGQRTESLHRVTFLPSSNEGPRQRPSTRAGRSPAVRRADGRTVSR